VVTPNKIYLSTGAYPGSPPPPPCNPPPSQAICIPPGKNLGTPLSKYFVMDPEHWLIFAQLAFV
jgi:hypothetical protein